MWRTSEEWFQSDRWTMAMMALELDEGENIFNG